MAVVFFFLVVFAARTVSTRKLVGPRVDRVSRDYFSEGSSRAKWQLNIHWSAIKKFSLALASHSVL